MKRTKNDLTIKRLIDTHNKVGVFKAFVFKPEDVKGLTLHRLVSSAFVKDLSLG